MCTLCTYTNTNMPKFSPSEFFGPSRYLIPTPGLTSKYPICAVCVCVCVYTHTPTYTPTRVKIEKTQTTPLSFLLSKKSPTPSKKRSHRLVEPPHPHFPMLKETNCTYMRYMMESGEIFIFGFRPRESNPARLTVTWSTSRLGWNLHHMWCRFSPVS